VNYIKQSKGISARELTLVLSIFGSTELAGWVNVNTGKYRGGGSVTAQGVCGGSIYIGLASLASVYSTCAVFTLAVE